MPHIHAEAMPAGGVPVRMDIESWLHSMSQPLTSISLALSIAAAPITEEERTAVLQSAQTECLRAMEQLACLRAIVPLPGLSGAVQESEAQA